MPNLLNKNLNQRVLNNIENNNITSEGEDANENENANLYNNNLLFKKDKYIYRPITIFSEIFNSSSVQTLLAIGNRPAPLTLVGYYLDCLGNFIVDYVNSKYNKNILLNRAEVKQIKLFNNQEFGISVTKHNSILNNGNYNIQQNTDKSSFNHIIIKTKSLVIATGGKQDELNPYYSRIIELKGANNVFRSDYLLKEQGYEAIIATILNSFINYNLNTKNENHILNLKKKKIVIIGGSHSGFSCAWILLNNPSTYKSIKIGNDYKPKFNPNCGECLKYSIKYKYLLNKINNTEKKKFVNEMDEKEDEDENFKSIKENELLNIDANIDILEKEFLEKELNTINYQEELENLKPCNCLGAVDTHIWDCRAFCELEKKDLSFMIKLLENDEETYADNFINSENYNKNDSMILNEKNPSEQINKNPKINSTNNSIQIDKKIVLQNFILYLKRNLLEIQILYRDHIRVYYPSEEDAIEDNYTLYNKKEALNKQGKIYPFIGIRGDAKELYRKIVNGEEKRINLVRTSSNEEQKRYIQEADYIVWACGYNSNNVKILDSKNHLIDLLLEDSGMIEVSKQLNILNKNKEPIKNLFGIGQGYSTKAPEIINGKKARADSIHLYNTHISQRLYNSLQGFFSKNNIDYQYKNANNNINNNHLNSLGNPSLGGNNTNVLNYNRRKTEKINYPNAINQIGNAFLENTLNQRKNSGGVINEETINNLQKQTGLSNLSNNLNIQFKNTQKITNNNKINSLNATNNNLDFNSNIKNTFVSNKIQKNNMINNPNSNISNQNAINNKISTISSIENNNNFNNKVLNTNKNKITNLKYQGNNINLNQNSNQFQNKTKSFLKSKADANIEKEAIDLNTTTDFSNENMPDQQKNLDHYSKNFNKPHETNNNNLFKNKKKNLIQETDLEFREKVTLSNIQKKANNFNNNLYNKNQNVLKRKPLSNIHQDGLNVQRHKSLNNQDSNLNALKALNSDEFIAQGNIKINFQDQETLKKASSDIKEYNYNNSEISNINNINNSSFNLKKLELNLGDDEISRNIQMQMEKISNDSILKSQNDTNYSGNMKSNTNLNLPGFNSLNEMNKQSQNYTNNRKDNNNLKKIYSSNNLYENFEVAKENFENASNHEIYNNATKNSEKSYDQRDIAKIKDDSLTENTNHMLIKN